MLDHRPALELPELSVRQLVTATLVVGLVALAVWMLFRFHQVVLILAAGVIISTALKPVVEWLRRRGLPASASVLLLFGVLLAVIILFVRFGAPLVAEQAANIGQQLADAYSGLIEWMQQSSNLLLRRLAEVLPAEPGLPGGVSAAPAASGGVEVAESPFDQLWQTVGVVAGSVYKTLAIFFIAFFWTIESERIEASAIALLPLARREPTRALVDEIEGRVGGYVAGQLLLSAIIGTLSLVAYWIIGLPYALVLALVVALFEFIPVIGPLIGAIPSIIIGLSVSPVTALWVLIASLIIHQLESNVFGPRVMKRTLGMRPLVTLVAMTAFGTLFGVLGALIALPLTAIIQLLLERYLLSNSPPTETTGERDQIGLLRYQTQELVEDVRKVLRQREGAPTDEPGGEHLEDTIEAIALDLDKLLGQARNGNGNGAGGNMKRLAIYVAIIAVTVAALILLWQFRSVLILLLLSLMLAAALRPSADFLQARGLSVSLSWLLVYLGLFVVVGLALFLFGGRLLDELRLLSNYLVVLYDYTYQRWDNSDSSVAQAIIQRLPPPDQLPEVMAGPSGLSILRVVFGVGQNLAALVAALVIIIVLSLYWATDRAHFERLWLSLLPTGKRVPARSIWQTTEASVGDYLRSELVQAALAVVILGISYRLIGLDYPILAALLAGFAWLIPLAGFVFAAGFSFLAGMASDSGLQVAIIALVITAAVLAFLEFVVEPRFFRRDKFSGLLIVLVVLLMVEAYGLIGFVIAPPLAVALQILGSHLVYYVQRPARSAPQIDALEERLSVAYRAYNSGQALGDPPAPEIGSLLGRLEDLVEQTRRVAD